MVPDPPAPVPCPLHARTPHLTIAEVHQDDFVLLDIERLHFHHLNRCALEVLSRCNGTRDPSGVRDALQDDGYEVVQEHVDAAIACLRDAGLLTSTVCTDSPAAPARVSRRGLLRKGAVGAGITLAAPIVRSVTAPVSAQVGSVCGTAPLNAPCGPGYNHLCASCCCCTLFGPQCLLPAVCVQNGGTCIPG